MANGRITHVEFPADDVARAKRFYGAVAGWEFQPMEGFPDYELFSTGDRTGGAIGARGSRPATSSGCSSRFLISTPPRTRRARTGAG
jgi:predicted enzyme related to lactoylglutathione lyase